MSLIRPPVLSGSWYPAAAKELASLADGFLATAVASDRPRGRPLLAVVPHAGYVYSGATAGRLFGLLGEWVPQRIILLAPNHRASLQRIALTQVEAFATPLGAVPLDQAAVRQLLDHDAFELNDHAHANEHAVEIQLPLIQRTWPEGSPGLVPLLVPQLTAAQRSRAAAALKDLLDPGTLVVVSSDFTHYGASYGYVPFTADVSDALEKLDTGAILKILAADAQGLLDYGRKTGITMCGLEATALALEAGLPAGYEGSLIHYSRSGDRDGDYSLSVSYAAILLSTGAAFPDEGNPHDR